MARKKPAPQPYAKPDQIQLRGNQIFSPLRQKWLKATPEELVRQEFIQHLHDHYGYTLEQMDQERKTQHGRGSPRTDIVVYAAPGSKTPIIVVLNARPSP
jgi:type I restriction enzyme M protein